MQVVESKENTDKKISISEEMCLAGYRAYQAWEADLEEQKKSNRLGNLVGQVYLAMEREHREAQAF